MNNNRKSKQDTELDRIVQREVDIDTKGPNSMSY